jgi:hypothetical protein
MAKIDRCDVYLCVADLSEPRGPSSGWYDTRESVLVRLGDGDGRSGWARPGCGPAWSRRRASSARPCRAPTPAGRIAA